MSKIEDKAKLEDLRSPSEQQADFLAEQLKRYIGGKRGQYLRDEDGSLHVILDGRRIPINKDDIRMQRLMYRVCKVGTLNLGTRLAVQRLQIHADEKAGRMTFRRFSALSADGSSFYIPTADGRLLRVTAEGRAFVDNGTDYLWVEHPNEEPFQYSTGSDVQEVGLQAFERLLVETQSCAVPEMKWLVAMHEGLFPFIRDACPARLILVHLGSSQQGKTTGAQRFTLLHGLGPVMGDCTPASLGNMADIGLLVMDNKEQANFKQELIDFCLFLATGAIRVRSHSDGTLRFNRHRPAGVITTIEGVFKDELQRRCVEVQYAVSRAVLGRREIEAAIKDGRNEICSALMVVLQKYFQIQGQRSNPNPIPEFEEHFTALCDLLRAFGEVASKDEGWADAIVSKWDEVIRGRGDDDEDELEQPLQRVFDQLKICGEFDSKKVIFEGKEGKLFVTTSTDLLTELQRLRLYDRQFPRTANALSRRLHGAKFKAFRFLDQDSAPEIGALRRKGDKRPIGFFFEDEAPQGSQEDDAMTANDNVEIDYRHTLIN